MLRSPLRGLRAPVKLLILAATLFVFWRILPVLLPEPSFPLSTSTHDSPSNRQFDYARERSNWSAAHAEDGDEGGEAPDPAAAAAAGRRPPPGRIPAGYREEGGAVEWAPQGAGPPKRAPPPPRPPARQGGAATYEEELKAADARREAQRQKLRDWDERIAAAQRDAQAAQRAEHGLSEEEDEVEGEEEAAGGGRAGGRMERRPKKAGGVGEKRPGAGGNEPVYFVADDNAEGPLKPAPRAKKPMAGAKKKSPLIQVGGAGKAAGVPGAGGGAQKVAAAAKAGKQDQWRNKGWDQRFKKAPGEGAAAEEAEKEHVEEDSKPEKDAIPADSEPVPPSLLDHHLVRRLAYFDFAALPVRSQPSSLILDPTLEDSFQADNGGAAVPKLGVPTVSDAPRRYNLTICAMVPNEQRFLPEWLLYHRLIGVERFALYDTSAIGAFGAAEIDALADHLVKEAGAGELGPTVEELKQQVGTTNAGPDGLDEKGTIREERIEGLERWIDHDTVKLHWLKYSDADKAQSFLEHMLEHCTATYGPTTEWLGTLDVDEFLSVSSQLYAAEEPYLSTDASTGEEAGQTSPGDDIAPPVTLYPLHDILARPQTADAACIPLPALSFRNTGVRELKKGQGVLDTQGHRDLLKQGKKLMREEGLQQKTLIHTAFSADTVSFVGPHSCEVYSKSGSVSTSIKNSQGSLLQDGGKYKVAKLPIEPLSIAHYLQRDLADCISKLGSLSDPNDLHAKGRGALACEQHYLPSPAEVGSRAFREDKQNRFLLETPVEGSVIEDRRMKDSWAARAAKEVLEEWRHQGKGVAVGGVPKSVIDRARRKVEVLTF